MDKKLAKFLSELKQKALKAGASDATIIDVFKLIQDVGWEIYPITRDSDPESIPSGVLAGLVLVA